MSEHDRIRGYLGNVLRHGDIVPVRDHAPTVKLARDRLEAEGYLRWDCGERVFRLTSLGLAALSREHRTTGVVLPFRARTV